MSEFKYKSGNTVTSISERNDLVGIDLKEWRIREMTRVYNYYTNAQGYNETTLGYFDDDEFAETWIRHRNDNFRKYSRTPVVVLTNGVFGFELAKYPEKLLKKEEETDQLRSKIRSKLSKTEQKLLGLE